MNVSTLSYYYGIPFGHPVVRFYAICILFGACVALFLSDYRAHKDGYDWHFFDTVFPLALIAGIIGARIWYVVASWDQYSGKPFWEVFDMRNGGLAIQGGAIGGVLVGALYCIFRRRGTSILKIMDFAVPTIIIAQMIGRWGNFFNQEVFGHFVSADAWNFLPSFITNNMQNGDLSMGVYIYNGKEITDAMNGIIVPSGSIAAPLFLVEGVVNILFYFLIAHGVPDVLGKHYRNGDQAFAYFVSYGIIRIILEPLRNAHFIMGDSTGTKTEFKSYSMAIAFIAVGVSLIVINHVLHYLARKGKFDSAPKFKAVFVENIAQTVVEFKRDDVSNKTETKEDSNKEIKSTSDDYLSKLRAKEEELKNKDKE